MKYISIVSFVLAYLILGGQENNTTMMALWVYPTVLVLAAIGLYSGNRALNTKKSQVDYVSQDWLTKHGKEDSLD